MSDEQTFLQVIQADPTAVAPLLLFADWLEEHGDVRGELIRIEEEIKGLPVYADHYWQLKPRRQELWKQVSRQRLWDLGYSSYGPLLFGHGWPDD